ncbi:WXG100 family type VII secretion target [Mycobacterium sp. NPDC006124]|uniref:WXG100 family type VII secretion target n=1 Tax=Mycobacterium sp. NPDC006124 TaxID=3156729 RepID=UPI0033B89ABC
MDNLRVNADAAFATSHAVSNDAEELRDGLHALLREWDNLSQGWSGAAATGYAGIWAEWHEGANKLIDALAESSRQLGVAAVRYEEQDAASAEVVDSTTINLGL